MKKASLYFKPLLLFSLVIGLFGLFRCTPTLSQTSPDGNLRGDASVVEKPIGETLKEETHRKKMGKCIPNQLLREYGKMNLAQYKESDYGYTPPSISSDLTTIAFQVGNGLLFLRNIEHLKEKNAPLKSCATKRPCGARRILNGPSETFAIVTIKPQAQGMFRASNLTYGTYKIEELHSSGKSLHIYTYPRQEVLVRFQTRAHVAYSAQGKQLAATMGVRQHPTGEKEKYLPYKHLVDLVVWETKSQTKKYAIKIEPMAAYGELVFSKDNRYIALSHPQNGLSIYDSRTGKRMYRYQRKLQDKEYNLFAFTSLAFHPKNSSIIAFLSWQHCDITVMNFKTQTVIKRLSFPRFTKQGYDESKKCLQGTIDQKITFSPDGSWLLASFIAGSVPKGRRHASDLFLWRTQNYRDRWILPLPQSKEFRYIALQWSKSSQQFLASSSLHSWLFGCKK